MENKILCPFNHKACVECGLYRGRHYYRTCQKELRANADRRRDRPLCAMPNLVDFRPFEELLKPQLASKSKNGLKMSLKVIDMEEGTTRICEAKEVKKWNWSNPEIMRLVDGWQVDSLDRLWEILNYKAEKGCKEVEIYEVPHFSLLAGG